MKEKIDLKEMQEDLNIAVESSAGSMEYAFRSKGVSPSQFSGFEALELQKAAAAAAAVEAAAAAEAAAEAAALEPVAEEAAAPSAFAAAEEAGDCVVSGHSPYHRLTLSLVGST
jgi:hypothetical protein